MDLQMGGIDHHSRPPPVLSGQAHHDPGEDASIAPTFLSVVECLVGAILPWGVAPPQAIAIDENNAAQDSPVIEPGLAVRLRKIRIKMRHLLIARLER